MTKEAPDTPLRFHEVLEQELAAIGKPVGAPAGAPESATPGAAAAFGAGADPDERLKAIYAAIGRMSDRDAPHALCLSGGGIRSATFNLGVLQALARLGILDRFDYLSSVSGGGFIAGWFKAWARRVGFAAAAGALRQGAAAAHDPLQPEPGPVTHLREFSNYLTPRTGLLSADTWTLVALTARNLFLNWLVLLPVLMVLVAIPQGSFLVAAARNDVPGWFRHAAWLGLGFGLVASASANYFRRRRDRPSSEKVIVGLTLAPLWVAALFLSLGALWVDDETIRSGRFASFCFLWAVAMPILGWILGAGAAFLARRVATPAAGKEGLTPPWADLSAILVAGSATFATILGLGHLWLRRLQERPAIFVIVMVPLLLGLYLLSRALFVALLARYRSKRFGSEEANADREWWARLSAWLLIAAVAWTAASGLVLLAFYYLEPTHLNRYARALLPAVGGVGGLLTALLGASSRTGGGRDSQPDARNPRLDLGLKLLAPVTIALILVGLAALNALVARLILGVDLSRLLQSFETRLTLPDGMTLLWALFGFSAFPLAALLVAWILGFWVNVNIFSAQGLYRNRLVRAYLGASHSGRRPDRFTGFDPADNLPMAELAVRGQMRPFLVVNAALNLVKSAESLAWQQRKAESFTMTALHCGSHGLGYRRSAKYGGPHGVSLGAAITISGAAANPNSGYHSSPVVSFLMTLFNARLGSWLGNPARPGWAGEKLAHRNGPAHAWWPLLGDLVGLSDSRHRYISLSDGGHFENLGLYEMILRRCRLIVVSDAGCDPDHSFEDLGNAIRKVRIDLGVPIVFPKDIHILPRRGQEGKPGVAFAIGRIGYDQVDGGGQPGCLIYIKPTLRAEECPVPRDILAYADTSDRFPHEPTTDQWFSESQFESYRALGEHLARSIPPESEWKAPDDACPLP